MTRRVMYQVAMSLDGYIAGPKGDHTWITMDPAIDFIAQCRQFDTAIMGRTTYANAVAMHGDAALPGLDVVVFSRTLERGQLRGGTLVRTDVRDVVREMKAMPGSDIWLFGGGALTGQLLDARLIDCIDVAIMPVTLGEGTQCVPSCGSRCDLEDRRRSSPIRSASCASAAPCGRASCSPSDFNWCASSARAAWVRSGSPSSSCRCAGPSP